MKKYYAYTLYTAYSFCPYNVSTVIEKLYLKSAWVKSTRMYLNFSSTRCVQ